MRKKTLKKRKTQKKKKKKTEKNAEKEKEKKKKKGKKKTHLKRTCAEKRVRHPELVRFGPLFPTTFLHREKKKTKKKAALPNLLCQPCFGNPFLPTLLCHLCFANPAWRTLIFRSIMFFFYVFEGGGLGDKGGTVNVFLCFSLFLFLCVF